MTWLKNEFCKSLGRLKGYERLNFTRKMKEKGDL